MKRAAATIKPGEQPAITEPRVSVHEAKRVANKQMGKKAVSIHEAKRGPKKHKAKRVANKYKGKRSQHS